MFVLLSVIRNSAKILNICINTTSSESLDILSSEIENICGTIQKFLLKNTSRKSGLEDDEWNVKHIAGSVCYLYRHHKDLNTNPDDSEHTSSLRYDMIRMLIRGCEHPHTLCLHVCDGLSEFHVYSKKGRVSFCPEKDALVITIGDQLQVKIVNSCYSI